MSSIFEAQVDNKNIHDGGLHKFKDIGLGRKEF